MRNRILLSLALVASFALSGCKGFLEFTEKVAAENSHAVNSVIIAHKDGFVSDESERAILVALRKVSVYDDAAAEAYAAQNKAGALAQIDQALATIDTDVANGVAGVKNPDKQLEIQAVVAGLRSLLTTAKIYVVK